jgi:hypothetical protein
MRGGGGTLRQLISWLTRGFLGIVGGGERNMSKMLIVLLCQAISAGDVARLPFDTYSGYFVSNKFEPDATASFVVIADQAQFDKVFGVAFVMRDKSHRLPKDAFQANVVVAVIRRGNASWEYKVKSVTVEQGAIKLRYAATSKTTPDTTFACPLIVSIPKGAYTAVTFIEDDKEVKTLQLASRRADPNAAATEAP